MKNNQLYPVQHQTLYLASESFRRQELLSWLGVEFEIVAHRFDEAGVNFADFTNLADYVKTIAIGKAVSLENSLQKGLVLAADTMVIFRDQVIGKPRNLDHSREILKDLFGQRHQVSTGVCLFDLKTKKIFAFSETAFVTFRSVSRQELEEYLSTGEPLGKAGAYAIHNGAAKFVKKIEGDVTTVIGLPLKKLAKNFSRFGFKIGVDVEKMIKRNLVAIHNLE